MVYEHFLNCICSAIRKIGLVFFVWNNSVYKVNDQLKWFDLTQHKVKIVVTLNLHVSDFGVFVA